MEHAVSDLLVDRIDEYLSYPETDPHGDPIPRSDGSVPVGSIPVRCVVWGTVKQVFLFALFEFWTSPRNF
jgi:hypothetical protein